MKKLIDRIKNKKKGGDKKTGPTPPPPPSHPKGLSSEPPGTPEDSIQDRFKHNQITVTLTGIINTLRRNKGGDEPPEEHGLKNLKNFRLSQWIKDPSSRESLQKFTAVSLILLSLHFAAGVTGELLHHFLEKPKVPISIASTPTYKRPQTQAFSGVVSRNLFNRKGIIPDVDSDSKKKKTKEPVTLITDCTTDKAAPSSLPYALIGTIILSNHKKSIISLRDQNKNKVIPLRIGESIDGKIQVTDAKRLKVAFTNLQSNRCESLEIKMAAKEIRTAKPGSKAAVQAQSKSGRYEGIQLTGDNTFNIEKNVLDQARSNMGEILTQALAVPVQDAAGNISGFRLTEIAPQSIYEQLGLQNNDIICGVNGAPITQVDQALEMMAGIDKISHLELCINRGGNETTFNYDIR